MLAELDPRAATSEDGGTVVEKVDGADVAAVGQAGVIKEAAAVGFLGGLELVDEPCQKLALRGIARLRGLHARAGGVVAHVVWGHLEPQTLQQRTHRLAVGEHAGGVRLQRGHDERVHHLDLLFPREARLGLGNLRLGLGHAEPLLVLAQAHLDVADALEVLVQLVGVGFRQALLHAFGIFHHGIQHAALLSQLRLALAQRRAVV